MAEKFAASDEFVPTRGDMRLVIGASSLGTVFEWYDFFVYGILAALLGSLAVAPLLRDPRSRPSTGTIVACLVLGGSALALDAAQVGLTGGHAALLASLEEWCELAMESLLTAAYFATLGRSRVSGRLLDDRGHPDQGGWTPAPIL